MTIYIGVMALEFAPVLMEKFGWKVSLARINKVMFFILALGPCCPPCTNPPWDPDDSGGEKIHPLWQSYELLPVFSLLTAFIMGFSIVVFEGSLVQAGLAGRGPNEKPLFYKLTQVIDIFLILFVALRFAEIVINDKSEYLSQWDRYALMFWSEIALMIFPLLVFHWDKSRRDSRMLFLGPSACCWAPPSGDWTTPCSPSTPAMATTTSLRGGSADLLGLCCHRGVCLFAADPALAGTAIT